jgi:beta-galactosidase
MKWQFTKKLCLSGLLKSTLSFFNVLQLTRKNMIRSKLILSILLCFILCRFVPAQTQNILFDSGWKFHHGGAQGAEVPGFDDSGWRSVDLPHDWSIEDIPGTLSPFSRDAVSQVSGGFTTGGTGWYRKAFKVGADQTGKRFVIRFDGVYMNSHIWINGAEIGNHPYGYTSFWFDITSQILPGKQNVVAVKVLNEGENSRWYSGSGIYRHVWLKITEPLHIGQWGVRITTPQVAKESATVNIKTTISNQSEKAVNIRLITHILNPKGEEIASAESLQESEKGDNREFTNDIVLKRPDLWSTESPALYSAVSEVYLEGRLVDSEVTQFGIRRIEFDNVKGLSLNGNPIKLQGGCFHHDNGPLGSKSYDRAEERKVELLKASGFNAIRCSHNPPAPAFLDACDRLGMLVIDEAFDMWQYPKNPNDYSLWFEKWWQKDVSSMISRDINHPSIIIWSIGNEIPGIDSHEVVETAQSLADLVRKTDPSRPVIAAVNNLNQAKDPFFAALDIAGYNYGSGGDHMKENIFVTDHKRIPSRVMIQTESYPLEAFRSWMDVTDNPWLLGDFVWTAFDYIGEASIGWRGYFQKQDFYPWNLAFCGDIDICGWKRPQSYYRDVLWKKDQISVFVTPAQPSFEENRERMSWSKWHWNDVVARWNWQGYENRPFKVTVYSSCDEAELFINNRSLGRKKTDRSSEFKAEWEVPYQPGDLVAKGYTGKKQVNSAILGTAGEVTQIKLNADRTSIKADNNGLCYITVELCDDMGRMNPVAENLLKFKIEGPGKIVAVGNANPVSTESFQAEERKAWRGRCLVIVKAENKQGDIVLNASSDGMKTASVTINAR